MHSGSVDDDGSRTTVAPLTPKAPPEGALSCGIGDHSPCDEVEPMTRTTSTRWATVATALGLVLGASACSGDQKSPSCDSTASPPAPAPAVTRPRHPRVRPPVPRGPRMPGSTPGIRRRRSLRPLPHAGRGQGDADQGRAHRAPQAGERPARDRPGDPRGLLRPGLPGSACTWDPTLLDLKNLKKDKWITTLTSAPGTDVAVGEPTYVFAGFAVPEGDGPMDLSINSISVALQGVTWE